MKKAVSAVVAAALLLAVFLTWQNYHLKNEIEVLRYGIKAERLEIDSLKTELGWHTWADTVDGGAMARKRYK